MFTLLFLSLSWLAPIIALLVLNFKEYIAGASVACGVRDCNGNPWSFHWGKISDKLDREAHGGPATCVQNIGECNNCSWTRVSPVKAPDNSLY
jgi:hypothetical protein